MIIFNRIKGVFARVVDNETCEKMYEGSLTNRMICIGVPSGGRDSCRGDGGGPALCDGQLAGIVSWGLGRCGIGNQPGVYTRTSSFIDWMMKHIKPH